jgi:hypothetical protein
MNMENIASEIKPGDIFRVKGKIKFRECASVIELTRHDHIDPVGRKLAIICIGCKQVVVLKDTPVEFQHQVSLGF